MKRFQKYVHKKVSDFDSVLQQHLSDASASTPIPSPLFHPGSSSNPRPHALHSDRDPVVDRVFSTNSPSVSDPHQFLSNIPEHILSDPVALRDFIHESTDKRKNEDHFQLHPDADRVNHSHFTSTCDQLREQHLRFPAPQWHVSSSMLDRAWRVSSSNVDRALACSAVNALLEQLTYALAGIENGITFTALHLPRFEPLSDSVLSLVQSGLSRPFSTDTHHDLYQLRDQVIARDKRALAQSIYDVTHSSVPIFAVLYSPKTQPSPWRLDDKQMKSLLMILNTLTGGKGARIWMVDLAMMGYSKQAVWQRVGLLPFALYPAVVLDHELRGLQAVFERMAKMCLGVVQVVNPADWTLRWLHATEEDNHFKNLKLRSGVNKSVTKLVGNRWGVKRAIEELVVDIVTGEIGDEELRNDEWNRSNLMSFVNQVATGKGLDTIMLGLGDIEQQNQEAVQENAIFHLLARYQKASLRIDGQEEKRRVSKARDPIRARGIDNKWEGIQEFVGNPEYGRHINIQDMKRQYDCLYYAGRPWMIARAKLEGNGVELYGAVLVRMIDDDPKRGTVSKVWPVADQWMRMSGDEMEYYSFTTALTESGIDDVSKEVMTIVKSLRGKHIRTVIAFEEIDWRTY